MNRNIDLGDLMKEFLNRKQTDESVIKVVDFVAKDAEVMRKTHLKTFDGVTPTHSTTHTKAKNSITHTAK